MPRWVDFFRHPACHRSYARIVTAADLPEDVTLHGLRHTCASLLLASGVNPKIVAEKLGQSVDMTLNIYSHVLPSSHTQASAALDDMFS